MKKCMFLCAVAQAVSVSGMNAATDTDAADSIQVVNLQEVAIVASRATAKTPIAYTNVTGAELNRISSGQDLPYLLSMTPSLITTSDAGAGVGYTSLRVRGSDGSRINVTANGIPINDAESHNVYWVNMPDLSSSLKDVQVQRGVGTSTNGAGAFGASVNMVTDTPSRNAYGEFDGSYGMYNTHKETLRVGSGLLGDHWTVDMRLSNIGSDGYIERASSDLYSYFAQAGYYAPGTSVRLLAFGGKQRTYMAWDYASKEDIAKYGRRYNPCGEYTDSEGNRAYYPNQNDNYTQHHFQLLWKQHLSQYFNLDMAFHYTKGDGYYEQYKTNRTLLEYGLENYTANDGTTITKSDLVRLKKMDNGFGGGIFNLNYSNGRVNGTLGGALNHFSGWHFGQIAWVRNYIGALNPLQEYYRNKGRKTDANIYARANVDIIDGLSAYADIQYRYINYSITGNSDTYDYSAEDMQHLDIRREYNFLNPKLGLNWQPNEHHRLFASWSVAHKEPVRDNFIDSDPDHLPTSERLFDYELGYNFTIGRFSAGANLYYMDYKDQLVLTGQLSDTGNSMSVNVPSSYRGGIELQAAWHPLSWFEWTANATFSRNRIKDFTEYIYDDRWQNPITVDYDDVPIAFSPDITVGNTFQFKYCGLDAALQSRYVSKQYMSNVKSDEQMLDAYFVSDLHIGYTFDTIIPGVKSVRLGLSVFNIFNEKYENNGYAGAGYYMDGDRKVIYRYAGYAVQAPIHVMGSVSVKF